MDIVLLFLFSVLLLPKHSSSYTLCTNSRVPFKLENLFKFCSYSGSACCDSAKDLELQKQFQALNVSDPACFFLLMSIFCATCDQSSAELFKSGSGVLPVLCNSTVLVKSLQSNGSASMDLCARVWDTCGNRLILNSPFAPSVQGKAGNQFNPSPAKLTDQWQSRRGFSEAFGKSSDVGAVCYNGKTSSFNDLEAPQPPKGLCLEKIGNGTYINMVPHPDGSNRVFLSNQQGKIWLVNVPDEGSNRILEIPESKPFIDLTNEVLFDIEFGLMGMAFHPNFTQNGRFFVSFNCDKMKQQGCFGRCSCNTDVYCDPSKLGADKGGQPCQYHSVIAEFTVNGTALEPSMAKSANPSEVRRIFTMGLPYKGDHAGQILFGPADGYLYFMMGDGSNQDDAYNFAQNKKSLLGKILRIDIDRIPTETEIDDLNLWGNYSIPKDNPYNDDKGLEPEIWALGFRNPWRCSFDSERPSYFLCGDTGQDQYEEVDMVTKGGNYGWRVYEGPFLFHPAKSPGGNTSASSIQPFFPVMGYSHSEMDKNIASASVTGGYFYRSMTDPCMYGRYLYMDLYAEALWAGTENPENSGNFTSARISFRCTHDSPIQCSFSVGSSHPALGYVLSFAEDNKKDIYILTSTGVYRVTRPSRCNYTCSKENVANFATPRIHSSSPVSGNLLRSAELLITFSSLLLLILDVFL